MASTLGGLNLYAYCGNNPIVSNLRSSNSSVNSIGVPIFITNENHNLFSLSFDVALADSDKLGGVADWIYSKVLYANGGLLNGLNLAYIDVGIGKFGLRTPNFFSDNIPDFINPRLYVEVGVVTAGAAVGLSGISAYIHLISGEVGLSSDYMSFAVKGYFGYGFKRKFINGFEMGGNLGLLPVGWEVDIQIDWIAIIQGLISWLKSYKK